MGRYVLRNWGSPFVAGFVLLLVCSAAELSIGLGDAANGTTIVAFYLLVLGVVLQVLSYLRYGESHGEPATPEKHGIVSERRSDQTAQRTAGVVTIVGIALLVFAVASYAIIVNPGPSLPITGPFLPTLQTGPAGIVAVAPTVIHGQNNITVPITINGETHNVSAAINGSANFAVNFGKNSISAPQTSGSRAFKEWAVYGSGMSLANANSSSTTLTVTTPVIPTADLVIPVYD